MAFDKMANLSTTSAAMKTAVLVAMERHPEKFVLIIVATGSNLCLHSLDTGHRCWLYVVYTYACHLEFAELYNKGLGYE